MTNRLFGEALPKLSVTNILSRNVNELKMWITGAMGDIMHNIHEYEKVPVLN